MHLVPMGASGVRLKSYVPLSWAHADRRGLIRDARSKLIVKFACGINLHHNLMGQFGSMWHNPDVRCVLYTCMLFSAAFVLWLLGGASWKSVSLFVI